MYKRRTYTEHKLFFDAYCMPEFGDHKRKNRPDNGWDEKSPHIDCPGEAVGPPQH